MLFSQFVGSCVCGGVLRPKVLLFRICHFPENLVLGRQMIRLTAFLLTIGECKEAEEFRGHLHLQQFPDQIQVLVKFWQLNSLDAVEVGVGESKNRGFVRAWSFGSLDGIIWFEREQRDS